MTRYRITIEFEDPRSLVAVGMVAQDILRDPERWVRLAVEQVEERRTS